MKRSFLLLLMACSAPLPTVLPQPPPPSVECEAHSDCPLARPQCLAGSCLESSSPDIFVEHLSSPKLLGEGGYIHWMKLNVPIRAGGLGLGTDWTVTGREAGWVKMDGGQEQLVVHESGFAAFRFAEVGWPGGVYLQKLRTQSPFFRLDQRAWVGGDWLEGLIEVAARRGVLETRDSSGIFADARHGLIMKDTQNFIVSDFVTGLISNVLWAQLGSTTIVTIWRRVLPLAAHVNPQGGANADRFLGRSMGLNLSETADFQVKLMVRPDTPEEGTTLRIEINGEMQEQSLDFDRPAEFQLPPGRHDLKIRARSALFSWLRIQGRSSGTIELVNWHSINGFDEPNAFPSIDSDARPRLISLTAGVVADSDGDHWPDSSDLCPHKADEGQDRDQDGVGDPCDGVQGTLNIDDRLHAVDAKQETLFAVEDGTNGEARRYSLVPLSHPISGSERHTGMAPGLIVDRRLGEAERRQELYQKDGSFWLTFTTPDWPWTELVATANDQLLTSADYWGVDEQILTTQTYLFGQKYSGDTQEVGPMIQSYSHWAYRTASQPSSGQNSLNHEIAGVGDLLFFAGRYMAMLAHFPANWDQLQGGVCVATQRSRFYGRPCTVQADCGRMEVCGRTLELPPGRPAGAAVFRCHALPSLPALRVSSFDLCEPTDPEKGCDNAGPAPTLDGEELVSRCLPFNDFDDESQVPVSNYWGSLMNFITLESMAGWIYALPVNPIWNPSEQWWVQPADDEGHVAVEADEQLFLSLCPKGDWSGGRSPPSQFTDSAYLAMTLRFFLSGQSPEDGAVQYVPGSWSWDGTCSPINTWRIPVSPNLIPRAIDLVDLNGDGIEEIRLQASISPHIENTAGLVYRCFDYQGQVIERGCEP